MRGAMPGVPGDIMVLPPGVFTVMGVSGEVWREAGEGGRKEIRGSFRKLPGGYFPAPQEVWSEAGEGGRKEIRGSFRKLPREIFALPPPSPK